MKKIIYPGKGDISDFRPETKAIFHFQTIKVIDGEDKVIDDSRKLGKPMELVFGKKFKLEVWEELVKTMKIGEVSRFHCKASSVLMYPFVSKQFRKYALGVNANSESDDHNQHESHCCGMAMQKSLGHEDLDQLLKLPTDLDFIIELLDVISGENYEKEVWQMNSDEQLKLANQIKDKGNQSFKEGDYLGASQLYEKALAILEQLCLKEKPGDEEWIILDKMRIPFFSNLAQCQLNLKDYYQTIKTCDEVISRDEDNVKAWFRRAKANLAIGEFDSAVKDFEKASSLDENLRQSVNYYLIQVEKERKAKLQSDKNIFAGKLFG